MNARSSLDLAGCEAEPIHVPGAIQPHGVLLALRPETLEVAQASDNLPALLGLPVPAPGTALAAVLGAPVAEAVRRGLPAAEGRGVLVGRHAVGGKPCDVIAHRWRGVAIVELEVEPRDEGAGYRSIFDAARAFVARLRDTDSIEAMCRLAASEVRRMTGFGHTMVYDFDAEGHGRVLAEDREADYPAYLGHRFPAADIPRQARELYRRNPMRLIADVDYRPARLVPALHPDSGQPTDLTHAALRSVSPVHLEYMRNMRTAASMSASILVRGELWGLISCHDHHPRRVPYAVRTAFEHVAQILALQIEAREERGEVAHRLELRAMLLSMLAAMGRSDGALDRLAELGDELLRFGAANGAVVVVRGRLHGVGDVPDDAALAELVAWLATRGEEVFATDRLAEAFPPAARYADVAAGLLAVSISKLHDDYLVWFRREVVQTVLWAGDPHAKTPDPGDGRLHPRTSFASWQEVLRGRSLPWRQSELDLAAEFRNALIGIVLRKAEEVAALAAELERSNAELQAFSYSVSHDLRAPLRHIAGYADLVENGQDRALSERDLRFVRNIKEAAAFAGSLVDGLLSFSRIGRTGLQMSQVSLDDVLNSVVRTAGFQAGGDVEWQIEPLPTVQGDPVLLKVAVENLVGNALKYSASRKPARIAVRAVDSGDQHGFAVEDNGVGFDMRYAHKLFGVFQRLHSMDDFEGTGIGLASVRRIAERHGGHVAADAEVDRGAVFTFTVPKRPWSGASPQPSV